MDDMNVAYINPRIITWAMAQNNLVPEQLATEAVTADKIRAWEQGEPISEDQAEFLANKLQIPYLVLFLPNPPQPDPVPIPDLRTRSGKPVAEPSREFIGVINDALMRQDWFREHKLRQGKQKLTLVGRFTTKDSVADVAANMRLVIGVNADFRQQCRSWEKFLRQLIKKVEVAGILVMRSGVVGHSTHRRLDAEEFQGFAISDPYAPLVFVNDTDARAAQIFTLAHELAHIWIGKTGISNARLAGRSLSELSNIERFCNQVAAEFLVPEKSFNVSWQPSRSIKANLERIQRHFWVSSLVALRRAYDLKKLNYDDFKAALDQEYAHYYAIEQRRKKREEEAKKKQTGDFWSTFKLRNSVLFSNAIAASVRNATTTYTEASNLLGVTIATVERFLHREKAAA
ncbi:ImmA/IrrE family metallo-endopeptidase [Alloacidobacterium dinghuense]|uniref:ImmA/IrrE family metallo-endopeptidase n=1 Tax=Alloacidobacterium dinghuense TaxID=2763107 RepID=A0A7G8BDT2_9BACT|nr:ImmA/IrrE family metallo-endopeptidase [Alloacidobacterium dinghuense]QNI30702.1 ImmA/IrrE family metallo-endopeptidase [Alloacidobacterium dinghuense]